MLRMRQAGMAAVTVALVASVLWPPVSLANSNSSVPSNPTSVRELILSDRSEAAETAWKQVVKEALAHEDKGASLIGPCLELGELAYNRDMLNLTRAINKTGLDLAQKLGPQHAREEVLFTQDLAASDLLLSKFAQAKSTFAKALKVGEVKLGASDTVLVRSLTALAYIAHRDGNATESTTLLDRAESICSRSTPTPYSGLVRTLRARADFAFAAGQGEVAKAAYDSALAVSRRYLVQPSPHTALLLASLSNLALNAGRFDDAHDLASEARQLFLQIGMVGMVREIDERLAYAKKRRDGPQYDSKYVQGQYFTIGRKGDNQVWLCASKGATVDLLVYITNGSDHSVTIMPEQIRVESILGKGDKQTRQQMKTYSASQYESKLRNANAWRLALAGFASSMANQPQPKATSVSGGYYGNSSGSYGSNTYSGSYYGTITEYPNTKDYADARARTNAQMSHLQGQLETSFDQMTQNLMRSHTLDPQSFYGGVVHAQKWTDDYVVTIPFDGEEYEYFFTFKKR